MIASCLLSGYSNIRLRLWSWSESREGSRFVSSCLPEGGLWGLRSWCRSKSGSRSRSRFAAVFRVGGWRSL